MSLKVTTSFVKNCPQILRNQRKTDDEFSKDVTILEDFKQH